jgi:hypothetical protein
MMTKSIYLYLFLAVTFCDMVNAACFSSLKALNNAQVTRAMAMDYGTVATYVLCPNTVFDAPFEFDPDYTFNETNLFFKHNNGLVLDGNSRYLCGEDGKSSNNCTIKEFNGNGGQILSLTTIFNFTSKDNILVSGITIDGSTSPVPAINIIAPGNIKFNDCVVQVYLLLLSLIDFNVQPISHKFILVSIFWQYRIQRYQHSSATLGHHQKMVVY